MMDEKSLLSIHERIGAIDKKAEAAHARMDEMKQIVRDDLKDLKDELKEVNQELKKVIAWMHETKGWKSGVLFLGGLIVGSIPYLIKFFRGD